MVRAPKSAAKGPKAKKTARHPVSAEDQLLWSQVTDDVTPLGKRPPPPAAAENEDAPSSPPGTRRQAPAGGPSLPSVKTLSPLTHGRAPGMDRRSAMRLSRGQSPIDARLDLHGMTQAVAHRALDDFLARCAAAGHRTALIITGKGVGKEISGGGVLKAGVPRWLNESPNRERILGFDYAQAKDGGHGALYVRLRKKT